jgi:hypothetical protein
LASNQAKAPDMSCKEDRIGRIRTSSTLDRLAISPCEATT